MSGGLVGLLKDVGDGEGERAIGVVVEVVGADEKGGLVGRQALFGRGGKRGPVRRTAGSRTMDVKEDPTGYLLLFSSWGS